VVSLLRHESTRSDSCSTPSRAGTRERDVDRQASTASDRGTARQRERRPREDRGIVQEWSARTQTGIDEVAMKEITGAIGEAARLTPAPSSAVESTASDRGTARQRERRPREDRGIVQESRELDGDDPNRHRRGRYEGDYRRDRRGGQAHACAFVGGRFAPARGSRHCARVPRA
jgi:hypothetical protein